MRRLPLALFCLAAPLWAQAPAGVDAAYFKGDPKAIMAACADRARAIKPNDSRLLAEYGRAYLASGDRARAEEAFAAAAKSDPKDGETYRLIAFAWQRRGFKAEAMAALEQMQLMDPKAKNAFAKAAVNLLDAGQEPVAEALMEKAWKLDPKDWQNCVEFARAAVRNQRSDLAARWFAHTVEARPREERMWNEIALAFADGGVEH
jgi:tetratricopeptide (TPR) repeat protein